MITLECNYSRKSSTLGYSSHQFSTTLKTEFIDFARVQLESARLYQLLKGAMRLDIHGSERRNHPFHW